MSGRALGWNAACRARCLTARGSLAPDILDSIGTYLGHILMNTSPLGLFITWTVYGTFLPGDARGWKHRSAGLQLARPLLETWHRDRLSHDIITLDDSMQSVAEAAIREICGVRSWALWATSVRTNHVHVVVTARTYAPKLVRD